MWVLPVSQSVREFLRQKKERNSYRKSTGQSIFNDIVFKCKENNVNAIFAGVSEFNLDRVKALTEKLGLPCYIEEAAWKYAGKNCIQCAKR